MALLQPSNETPHLLDASWIVVLLYNVAKKANIFWRRCSCAVLHILVCCPLTLSRCQGNVLLRAAGKTRYLLKVTSDRSSWLLNAFHKTSFSSQSENTCAQHKNAFVSNQRSQSHTYRHILSNIPVELPEKRVAIHFLNIGYR